MCAAKGYDLVLTLPQGMSRERESLLRLYGAQVHITESMGGMNEAVAAAQALARDTDACLPDQFSNPANPEAHRRTTGPELWDALDGKLDYLVARRRHRRHDHRRRLFLKERNAQVKLIAVEPAASAVLSGGAAGPHKIQGIGAGFVPPVLDRELVDEIVAVDDEDALETARLAARREGVLFGISCRRGAVRRAGDRRAPRGPGTRIAVVLPDSGERYVSTPFFAPEPEQSRRRMTCARSRAPPAPRGSARCTARSTAWWSSPSCWPTTRSATRRGARCTSTARPGVELDHPAAAARAST